MLAERTDATHCWSALRTNDAVGTESSERCLCLCLLQGADPKWRFMWRVGQRPAQTAFQELNAEPVIPKGAALSLQATSAVNIALPCLKCLPNHLARFILSRQCLSSQLATFCVIAALLLTQTACAWCCRLP